MQVTKELVYDMYLKTKNETDMSWGDIAEKHNVDMLPNTLRQVSVGIRMMDEAGCINFDGSSNHDEYAKLYAAKKQFYDQRREYNKAIADEARADHLTEELIKAANKLDMLEPLGRHTRDWHEDQDKEAVLVLSDWHFGMVTDNVWNSYDTTIAINRICSLYEKVGAKLQHNGIKKLHLVILGDMISGDCHVSIRVANSETAVDQLMKVSEYLAEFIDGLLAYVETVEVYSTYGNHGRVIQNLKDSVHADNLERIIPFWLKQRFINCPCVSVHEEDSYELIRVESMGNEICAVHGDLDTKADAGLKLSMVYEKLFEKKMKYLITGHMHHAFSNEDAGIEHIAVGSLVGTDEFAKDRRLFSKPSQTMLTFTEDGIDAIYNFDLSKA